MNDWISVKEMQEEFHVSRATAYRMVKNLPTVRCGNTIRISRRAMYDYMRRNNGILPTNDAIMLGGPND